MDDLQETAHDIGVHEVGTRNGVLGPMENKLSTEPRPYWFTEPELYVGIRTRIF